MQNSFSSVKILEETKSTEIHSELNRKRRTDIKYSPVGPSIWGQFGSSHPGEAANGQHRRSLRLSREHKSGTESPAWMKPGQSLLTRKLKYKVKSLSRVRLFATPGTVAYQASPSMGFSRQEYWSGLPFPSPGDFPGPGNEPGVSCIVGRPSEPPGKLNV